MYQIILVDNEPMFRSKFSKITDWNRFGFSLEACLSDGQEAISYLHHHPANVIFTDVQIKLESGTPISEYVRKNFPSVALILTCNLSDSLQAQEAVKSGAFQYLLKPIRKSEVENCLRHVKRLLDNLSTQNDDEMAKLLKRQTLFDIYTGVLTDEKKIQTRLDKIGFHLDIHQTPCVYFDLEIANGDALIKEWKYSKGNFYTALENILVDSFSDRCSHFPINYSNNHIEIISVLEDPTILADHFDIYLYRFVHSVRDLLKIEITYQNIKKYPSLVQMCRQTNSIKELNRVPKQVLDQYKLLFVNYFNSGDMEAAKYISNQILKRIRTAPSSTIRETFLEIFQMIGDATNLNESEIIEKIKNASDQKLSSVCKSALHDLLNIPEKTKSNYKSTIIDKAKEYIDLHYKEDISLENIADHVFLNKIYFCRFFKQTTGENFNDYLTMIRMNKAMEVLKDPSIKIYEVCEHVGYKTPRYFYKLFKNHTGYTPSEYRAKVLGDKKTQK